MFGENVVRLMKETTVTPVTSPLTSQLIRAATSVGANYCEANDAGSKKELCYRISICKRECRESKHWLRMFATALPEQKDAIRGLWREAKELHLIFTTIYRKVRVPRTERRSKPPK
ncbi:MAG TPA: four helix bundle protein [Pirellulales bacterium]